MKQTVKAGAEFDFTNPRETQQIMTDVVKEFFQEQARGVTLWRDAREGDVATGAVTIPAAGADPFGTNPGFALLVQYVRAQGLTTNDIVKVYRNSANDTAFIDQLTFTAPTIKFGGNGLILKGGEFLIFTGTGLTATTVTVNAEGTEVPEMDLYKMVVR